MPDLKSTATSGTRVLDDAQMTWFLSELGKAGNYALVVIVSSQPWVVAQVRSDLFVRQIFYRTKSDTSSLLYR